MMKFFKKKGERTITEDKGIIDISYLFFFLLLHPEVIGRLVWRVQQHATRYRGERLMNNE